MNVYKARPRYVNAQQFITGCGEQFKRYLKYGWDIYVLFYSENIMVLTDEDRKKMYMSNGDWLVHDGNGYKIMDNDTFQLTYERG